MRLKEYTEEKLQADLLICLNEQLLRWEIMSVVNAISFEKKRPTATGARCVCTSVCVIANWRGFGLDLHGQYVMLV